MTDKPNYIQAKEKATDLLKKHGIEEPIVPVFDIAEAEGVKLKFIEMPEEIQNVSGMFDVKNKIIFINAEDAPSRQVFTVAHELAHHILEHKTEEYDVLLRYSQMIEKKPKEQEANCFAANLLVPYKMLNDVMEKYSLKKNNIKLLAKIFGVSITLIKYRIRQLKYEN